MIEKLYDLDNLHKAFMQVKKVSGWKTQVLQYDENLYNNLIDLSRRLKEGKYRPKKPNVFLINERGKTRLIESYCIEDRIVRGCFTNEILMPICRPKLIYDNSASLKGRGTKHFRNRLEKSLKQFAKKHGNNGYILLGDFTKFFDNIWHETFLAVLKNFGADDEVIAFTKVLLKSHEVDVSYMTDEEYANCMYEPFNAIEYYLKHKGLKDGKRYMRKSVGIGSQDAQIAGVVTPTPLDNFVKIVKGVKDYGRYMDDFYIIHEDKEYLKGLLKEIKEVCDECGLLLNLKKTQIVKLRHRFTLLKTQYYITDDGKVVKIPPKDTFRREHRKLKKYKEKYDNGILELKYIKDGYKSWRQSLVKRVGVTKSIRNMDNFANQLFGGEIWKETKEEKKSKQD